MIIGRRWGPDIELENGTIKSISQNDYLKVIINEDKKDGKDIMREVGKVKKN